MIIKKHFICPGPTEIPYEASMEFTKPIIHHRSEEFAFMYKKIIHYLQKIYQTNNDLFIINGSGTAAMEAAVVNTLNSKKKVMVIRKGVFSERWGKICEAFNVSTIYFDIPYGKNINLDQFENFLKKNDNIQAVLTLYTETSTGSLYDIHHISKLIKKHSHALIIVDAITGILVHPCLTDNWGLDIVLSSSQKSYMTAPGISFLSFSKKAWEHFYQSDLPKFYFNLEKAKESDLKGFTTWTPPVHTFFSIYENLKWISKFSLNEWFQHYHELASLCRLGIQSLHLELFAENPSNALSAVKLPKHICPQKLVGMLYKEHNVKISLGYPAKGIDNIRIGHIGYNDISDLLIFFQAFEIILKKLDHQFELGNVFKIIQNKIASKNPL